MALLLGIPRAELDAEAFTRLTGIALDAVGLEQEMRQVLDYPPGLEVIVRLCPLEAEEGVVFIVARQAGEALESPCKHRRCSRRNPLQACRLIW